MSLLLTAGLAAGAAAVLVGLPPPGRLRLLALGQQGRRRAGLAPWHVAVVLAVPLLLTSGPVLPLVASAAAVAATRWRAARARARAREAERRAALHACRALTAELSAGRSPAEALAVAADSAAGPSAEALRSAAAAAALGGDVPGALLSRADGSAVGSTLRALAACWTVCAASGNGLAAAVVRLEEGLRGELDQRRAVDAELAGPRATAALLAVLPGGGLLMAAGLGADPLHVLLETPVGATCLVLGLLLDGVGVLWTQRLVARVRPP